LIVVLDYGINNIRSVIKAVEHLGFTCRAQPNIAGATKLIIPGVGAFGKAMDALAPLKTDLVRFAKTGNPILGICLGQQLLLDSSEEFGDREGLGLISGKVRYLPKESGFKVPHIGWSMVRFTPDSRLGRGLEPDSRFYFVHSLYTDCTNRADIAATGNYGIEFPAAIEHGNVWGTQFHPEKSGEVGLRVLENFLSC
jgi:glutamine amidotransferase